MQLDDHRSTGKLYYYNICTNKFRDVIHAKYGGGNGSSSWPKLWLWHELFDGDMHASDGGKTYGRLTLTYQILWVPLTWLCPNTCVGTHFSMNYLMQWRWMWKLRGRVFLSRRRSTSMTTCWSTEQELEVRRMWGPKATWRLRTLVWRALEDTTWLLQLFYAVAIDDDSNKVLFIYSFENYLHNTNIFI